MSENLVLAPFRTGLEKDLEPFLLDNDAFPIADNVFFFRGRIIKKTGTSLVGRLRRTLNSVTDASFVTDGSGAFSGNIFTILDLEDNASLALGEIEIIVQSLPLQNFTDDSRGNLILNSSVAGSVNYSTGDISFQTDPPEAGTNFTLSFHYFPNLPALGIHDFYKNGPLDPINNPKVLFFDQKYSYEFSFANNIFFENSFYSFTGSLLEWHGNTYEQFRGISYHDGFFVTNNNPGMHFATVVSITDQTSSTITMELDEDGLLVGDILWFNEGEGGTVQINKKIGVVTANGSAPTYDVEFSSSVQVASYTNNTAIAQTLTFRDSSETKDGLRVRGNFNLSFAFPTNSEGWLNFAPPLSDLTNPDYLQGALYIVEYSERVFMMGTYEGPSDSSPTFHPNRMRWSRLDRIYYTEVRPENEPFNVNAWFQVGGAGGFADINSNEEILGGDVAGEVLMIVTEHSTRKAVSTGNPLIPFTLRIVQDELGGEASNAIVSLKNGLVTIGDYGIIALDSNQTQRIDKVIPDEVFKIKNTRNALKRISGIRDFRNEYIYITYVPDLYPTNYENTYPTKTIAWNYRENNFSFLREQYTCYGTFREAQTVTWNTLPYENWFEWDDWFALEDIGAFPNIVGGNQKGFILKKDSGSAPDNSHGIEDISGDTVTCASHMLSSGDFIRISGALFDNSSDSALVNGHNFEVEVITEDTFRIFPFSGALPSSTYLGGGAFKIVDNFHIVSKAFNFGWNEAEGIRIGAQRFLLKQTETGQVKFQLITNFSAEDELQSNLSPYILSEGILPTQAPATLGIWPDRTRQSLIWRKLSWGISAPTIQFGLTMSRDQMLDDLIPFTEFELVAAVITFYAGGRKLV